MNVITRGVRNAFRNSIRTFSIVLIIGLSIGLALAMLVARRAVEDKIQTVKTSVGNTITVSPAGAVGFEGGGEPLTTSQIAKIKKLQNITDVTSSLRDRLTTSDTNLVSAIDAGTLGRRAAQNSGVNFDSQRPQMMTDGQSSDGSQFVRTFTPPVTVTGVDNTSAASIYGGDSVKFTSGEVFDATKDANVAVIGTSLATKNNLVVGSTFTAYSTSIKVVGIYDAGNDFANANVFMPLVTLQRLSGQTDQITSATVSVNSLDNIDSVVTSIKNTLGSAADVVNNQETAKNIIAPLENVKTISVFSMIGALVAGAVIILLTMTMIVRERRREIGVMKAIGSSNAKTAIQFMTEAVTLTILGLIVGLFVGVVAANPVTNALVTNSTSSSNTTAQATTGGGFMQQRGAGGPRSFGSRSVANIRNINTTIGWNILAYGAGAAIFIAIVGSAIPALLISKIRPAEVMRTE